MIRVIIADDEDLAREKIKRFTADFPLLKIVAECADGAAVLEKVEKEKPDILFLDIKMPLLDGISAAKRILKDKTLIIFTTAYEKYAVEAFELQAFDYLLKPFDKKRFAAALDRAINKLSAGNIPDYRLLAAIIDELKEKEHDRFLKRILVKEGHDYIPVPVNEIEFIESEGNYLNIYNSKNSITYLLRETLSAIEEKLNPQEFLRISRSALIRIDSVASMQAGFSGEYHLVMKSGKKLKTGRTYKDKLEKLF